jgi:lysophospholipase L1-like esterase
MLGDSITLGGNWSVVFKNKGVVNFGIGGDTTRGVLNRIDTIINQKPKKVFILIGINDLNKGYSVNEIVLNYNKIITKLQNKDIEVFVQSTIFVGNKKNKLNNNVLLLNQKLQTICKNKKLVYIDLNKFLSKNQKLDSKFSIDDVHLNNNGYKIWYFILKQYL